MADRGTINPMAAVRAAAILTSEIKEMGIEPYLRFDMADYKQARKEARGDKISPFFSTDLSSFTQDNAMWLVGYDNNRIVHLQAFRCDPVGDDFASWMLTWFLGLQHRNNDPATMVRPMPIESDIAKDVSGRAVYHGEFWVCPKLGKKRPHRAAEMFGQLGLILAQIKWNPSAIWALVSEKMTDTGAIHKMGYYRIQRRWITWEQVPKEAKTKSENLVIATKMDVENLMLNVAEP